MRPALTTLLSPLVVAATLALSGAAHAQGEAAPEAAAPPAAAAPEPAAEEDEGTPGWFRIDHDSLALQLWVGATHSLGPIDLATDIYVDSGYFAEFDIGPSFSIGPVSLLPMVGIGFDWSQGRSVTLIAPQLFTIVDLEPIYFESWIQGFMNDVSPISQAGGDNDLYTRNFLLWKATEDVHVGPQMEATFALNNDRDALASLPVGGRLNLAYGENNLLGLFLGYETQEDARAHETGQVEVDAAGVPVLDADGNPIPVTTDRGLVGRFTFVRTW